MTQLITMELVRPHAEITDDIFEDLKEAVKIASRKQQIRYGFTFSDLQRIDNSLVSVELHSSSKIQNPGRRMKGISIYLLRKDPQKYKDLSYFGTLFKYTA